MLQHTLKRAEIEINNIQIGMAPRSFKCFNSRARKPYEMMISEFMHRSYEILTRRWQS